MIHAIEVVFVAVVYVAAISAFITGIASFTALLAGRPFYRDLFPWFCFALAFTISATFLATVLNSFFHWLYNYGPSFSFAFSRLCALVFSFYPAWTAAALSDLLLANTAPARADSREMVVHGELLSLKALPHSKLMASSSSHERAITTALENAASVRTPLRAFTNSVITNAQVSALSDVERLALATARAADAETKGIDAFMRRLDRMTEMQVRQSLEEDIRDDRLAVQREALRGQLHKRELAEQRRRKERLEAERERLQARHSLEAERKFKDDKFDLGRRLVRARIADADVETTTAKAATKKLRQGEKPKTDTNGPSRARLTALMEDLKCQIREDEADGKDATDQRHELRILQSLAAKW